MQRSELVRSLELQTVTAETIDSILIISVKDVYL